MDDSPWRCVYHPWGLCFGAKPPVLSNVGVNHQTILHHLLPVSHGPTPASPQQTCDLSTFLSFFFLPFLPPFFSCCFLLLFLFLFLFLYLLSFSFSCFFSPLFLFLLPFLVHCHLEGPQQGWAIAKQTTATDRLTNRWPESCHCMALDP